MGVKDASKVKIRTTKPNRLEEIARLLPGNPIMYYAPLFKLTGSVNATLLLSHLLYWQGKGAKGDWTYKTIQDIQNEIGLTRTQQDSAIYHCVKNGILDVKRKGIPAKRHFRVNVPRLTAIIVSLQEIGKLERREPANQKAEKPQTITEITNREYTENREVNYDGLKKLNAYKQKYLTGKVSVIR